MPFEFKLPDLSQNQLLMAGLSTLGGSMDKRTSNPFMAALGGFQAGGQMDKANKEEERQQAAFEEQQRQKQAWDAMFNPQGGQQGPQYAQAGGGIPGAARTPGIAPPIPGQGMPGPVQAMMSNPQTAGLLQSMGPQAGGKFLLEQMFKKPGERKMVKGADGYNYWADTKERVIPGIEARDPKLLSPEAFDQQVQIRGAGRPETNLTVEGQKYGSIPSGYMLQEGPEGARMVPIPGGPAALKQEAAEQGREAKQAAVEQTADIVTQDIDRIFELTDEATIPTTGGVGGLAAGLPGTNAYDVASLLMGVKANIGFDRLQQMRESSPTGGALGNITEGEVKRLESVMGSLDQSQSDEQFKRNLKRVKDVFLDTVHGKGNRPKSGGGPQMDFGSMSDADLGNIDIQSLTPEQQNALSAELDARGY